MNLDISFQKMKKIAKNAPLKIAKNGKENLNYCTSCIDSYIPLPSNYSIIVCEKQCEEGEKEKCLTCDKKTNKCIKCNNGYYFPEDDTSKAQCKPCSVNNCKICYGSSEFETCESCLSSYFPIYENYKIKKCEICEIGEGEKCLECDKTKNGCSACNEGYKLNDGKCDINYSFKAIYITNKDNEEIDTINKLPSDIEQMLVGKERVEPSIKYTFEKKANMHYIYY